MEIIINNSLCEAVSRGRTAKVKSILIAGANPNQIDTSSWTPLMYASFLGHAIIVKELLQYGALLDYKNKESETALDIAMKWKKKKVIQVLIDMDKKQKLMYLNYQRLLTNNYIINNSKLTEFKISIQQFKLHNMFVDLRCPQLYLITP